VSARQARILAALAIGACARLAHPQTLTIDLAAQKPGEALTVSIGAGAYTVSVTNKIPTRTDYQHTARLITKPIPALDASVFGKAATATNRPRLTPPECKSVEDATNKLKEETTEAAVPKRRTALQDALDKAPSPACDGERSLAMLMIADTTATLEDHVAIHDGQALEVTITRTGADGKPLIWKKTFDAGDRGEWRTSYGFTFLPNEDERWFAKAGSEANKFTITQEAQRRRFDFAPSIFFTWVPGWKLSQNLDLGPTGGLGFDLSAPVVFAGLSVLWNENIALVGGAVVHQRTRLDGVYQPGQTIAENLAADKLTEKTYHLNGFFGLAFRFGSKPKGFAEKPAPAPPAATPSPSASASPSPSPGPAPAPAPATTNPPLAQPEAARPLHTTAPKTEAAVMVWVNLATKVYHCPGTRFYQQTNRGVLMSEQDALAKQYRPAYGKRCE
jgi:hypothetical protein